MVHNFQKKEIINQNDHSVPYKVTFKADKIPTSISLDDYEILNH